MLKLEKEGFILYYTEGQDPEEEFKAQYKIETGQLMNFWATIVIDLGNVTPAEIDEAAADLVEFEKKIIDKLA